MSDEVFALHPHRYLLFAFSSLLLLGLRESRLRAAAGKPYTLTPPLMVGCSKAFPPAAPADSA